MNKKTLEINLKKSAKESSELWNHNMGNFSPYKYGGVIEKDCFVSTCKICGMKVWVELNPGPNSTNIFGDAVSTNCKGL